VVAVIGHEPSTASIPASVTYEQHGILFLAPKSTDVRLTSHNFLYTFRLTPDDEELTGALAKFAAGKGWKRVGVLHQRTDQAESAAEYFVSLGGKSGVTVPFVRSFFHEPRWEFQDFRPMLAGVRTEMFDAIMLSDELPWAGRLLTDMAKMGVTQPILATDTLDSAQLWPVAKEAANNLYVASAVDPLSKDPAFVGFRDRFRRRFKADPGYGASQGYETFMLFVKACLLSNSADPVVVATTLRTNKWTELFGEVAFTPEGDVLGRDISIKRMRDGVFGTVAVEVEDAVQPEEDVKTPEQIDDIKSPEQVQP
jgi:branched-chain amino acid transport system substrate-binding protein